MGWVFGRIRYTDVVLNAVVFPLLAILQTPDGPRCECSDPKCGRVGKHPAVLWGELKLGDPVPRPAEGAGAGLKTGAAPKGSGVIVVDLDNDVAEDAFFAMGDVPYTFEVETPRGRHLYFQHPGFPVKNSASDLGKGIDIRGDGGFVVAPGSPHKSGETYAIVNDVTPVPAPEWLLEWLRTRPKSADIQPHEEDITDVDEIAYRREVYTKYLQRDAPARGPALRGKGDTTLFEVVQRGAYDLRLPTEDVLDLLREHYDPRCSPMWGDELDERVAHKANTAKTGSTRPRAEPPPRELAGIFGTLEMPPLPVGGITPRPKGGLGFEYGAWTKEPPPIDFLVNGLIPRAAVAMFFGRADSLKTWLLFSLAVAMANGVPWLGYSCTKAVKVGIVDFETGKSNVARRLYMLDAGDCPNLGAKSFPSLKPNDRPFWVELAREDFDVVIIDSLRKANPGANENESHEALVPLDMAAEFSELTGCAVIWIHHAKKESGDGWPEFRGSGVIEDQVDCSFAVRKQDVSSTRRRVEIRCEKPGDMRKPEPFAAEVEFDDGRCRAMVRSVPMDADGVGGTNGGDDMNEQKIRASIRLAFASGPLETKDKIKAKVKGRSENVFAEINALEAIGEIKKIEGLGYVLDSLDAKRERVFDQVRTFEGWISTAKLADAAFVSRRFVDGMVREGLIVRRATGGDVQGFMVVEK